MFSFLGRQMIFHDMQELQVTSKRDTIHYLASLATRTPKQQGREPVCSLKFQLASRLYPVGIVIEDPPAELIITREYSINERPGECNAEDCLFARYSSE